MPSRRAQTRRTENPLSAEAVAAFAAGDACRLYDALDSKPWETSPLDADPDQPCPWPPGTSGAETWPKALRLRAELQIAGKQVGEPGDAE